jgi:hypothetical protein
VKDENYSGLSCLFPDVFVMLLLKGVKYYE